MHRQSAGAVGLPGLAPLPPSTLLLRPRGQQWEQSTSCHHVPDEDRDRRNWPSGRCEAVKKEGSKGLGAPRWKTCVRAPRGRPRV